MKKGQNRTDHYKIMEKKIINTKKSPAPIGPYNQAVLKGKTLYISGQIALDAVSMKLNNRSISDETHQVMQNLKNILENIKTDTIYQIQSNNNGNNYIVDLANEINENIESSPELVNSDPYGDGWMIKIEIKDPAEIENLLSSEAYSNLI